MKPASRVVSSSLLFALILALLSTWLRPLSLLAPDRFGAGWPADATLGFLLGALALLLQLGLPRVRNRTLLGGVAGALLGGAVGHFLWSAWLQGEVPKTLASLRGLSLLAMIYAGAAVGAQKGSRFCPSALRDLWEDHGGHGSPKILDTSVIIDGRINDVIETGFLDGRVIIPQFVLRELQQVADSADALKRARGRKGLESLQALKKYPSIRVEITQLDFPEVAEVDLKLIELARRTGGKIVTNDFNLNKVARVRDIAVLNINELANALKPVVLPGESMRVYILKEGKEPNQGVAYLDDGTMVVVDDGRTLVGQNVDIVVTSVLQTTAGKMFFGRSETAAAIRRQPVS